MLILSRKENQKIRIGNNIVINILSIAENNVKIGIEASDDIKIYREEIYDLITQHTKEAVSKKKENIPTNIKTLKFNKLKKK
jgi:carbon storage regulator